MMIPFLRLTRLLRLTRHGLTIALLAGCLDLLAQPSVAQLAPSQPIKLESN